MRYRIIIEMDAKSREVANKFARFVTDGKDGVVYVATELVLDDEGHGRSWLNVEILNEET